MLISYSEYVQIILHCYICRLTIYFVCILYLFCIYHFVFLYRLQVVAVEPLQKVFAQALHRCLTSSARQPVFGHGKCRWCQWGQHTGRIFSIYSKILISSYLWAHTLSYIVYDILKRQYVCACMLVWSNIQLPSYVAFMPDNSLFVWLWIRVQTIWTPARLRRKHPKNCIYN